MKLPKLMAITILGLVSCGGTLLRADDKPANNVIVANSSKVNWTLQLDQHLTVGSVEIYDNSNPDKGATPLAVLTGEGKGSILLKPAQHYRLKPIKLTSGDRIYFQIHLPKITTPIQTFSAAVSDKLTEFSSMMNGRVFKITDTNRIPAGTSDKLAPVANDTKGYLEITNDKF